jgi:MoaA/NifB/PqqE/SkfB family radical SAM enzyme
MSIWEKYNMTNWSKKMWLLMGLLSGNKAYTGPFIATIDLTRRCNLKCPGCRFHSSKIKQPAPGDQSKLDLPEETFKRLVSELKEMGTEYLVLTGEGEPFLHSRLVSFVSAAKNTGFKVTLFTNGTLMDNAKLQGLVDVGIDTLRVSLWASSEEEYQTNYPGTKPGTYKKIIGSLKRLAQIKKEKDTLFPLVSLHRPINCDNIQGVDAMVRLAYETCSNKVSFSPFKTRRKELANSALSGDEEKHIKGTLCKMKKKLKSFSIDSNIDQTLLRYDIGESVWEKLPCYIGWVHLRIKVDGTVLPCNPCYIPIGSLNKNTLTEIWNGRAMREFRRKTKTREGLSRLSKDCDCGFCCHLGENLRIHRIFKWFSPFLSYRDIIERDSTEGLNKNG